MPPKTFRNKRVRGPLNDIVDTIQEGVGFFAPDTKALRVANRVLDKGQELLSSSSQPPPTKRVRRFKVPSLAEPKHSLGASTTAAKAPVSSVPHPSFSGPGPLVPSVFSNRSVRYSSKDPRYTDSYRVDRFTCNRYCCCISCK